MSTASLIGLEQAGTRGMRKKGRHEIMKVCVIGLGYIGFPTACVMAEAGHEVLGVDVNTDLIEQLSNGVLHIVNEAGLTELAQRVLSLGHLRVSKRPAVSDVFVIAVPTPLRDHSSATNRPFTKRDLSAAEHGGMRQLDEFCLEIQAIADTADLASLGVSPFPTADLSYVEHAVQSIASFVKPGGLVILESTVPPGTTTDVVCSTLQSETGLDCAMDILVAHAPERVLPGDILRELRSNDRIVGGVSPEATQRAVEFYRTFVTGSIVGTDATTAETVKLMENTFRDVNIALANEFALIAEQLGVNVFDAIDLANRHPRVSFLRPGPGVGGHCIAVDPYFIMQSAPEQAQLIRMAREVNSGMPSHVLTLLDMLVEEATRVGKHVHTVGLLGASYKPNVGDERESLALRIADLARNRGYDVIIHDPYIERYSKASVDQIVLEADILVMITDHDVYRAQITPSRVRNIVPGSLPWILDTRGFFDQCWDTEGYRVKRLGVGERLEALYCARE